MSRATQRHQAVAAKVQATQMTKVATVALVCGRKVVSHHTGFDAANVALCAALDAFYANADGTERNAGVAHSFDIVPLSTIPPVGTDYDQRTKVWMP